MTDQEKILRKLLAERILLLDGAMGTMIQQHKLTEEDYRGGVNGRFAKFSGPEGKRELFLKGNNELLSLTQPHIIQSIHEAYLDAGSDIIETNTFGATEIAQEDYAMSDLAYEMNLASAKLAREAVKKFSTKNLRSYNHCIFLKHIPINLKINKYNYSTIVKALHIFWKVFYDS